MHKPVLDNVRFLTARRAYEFGPDDIRLSTLSTPPVEVRLRELFQFRTAVMGSPAPMFGDVPASYPPGYVFDVGFWISPEGELVPIRFIHFELQRIVIDVAGKSSAIESIYQLVREAVAGIQTPDGSPVIGEPHTIRDYSELTAQCNFPLDAIIPRSLRGVFSKYSGVAQGDSRLLLPSLTVDSGKSGEVSTSQPTTSTFTFAIRVGTKPEEHEYFSGAPLESDTHLTYLTEFAQAITAS